MIEKPWSQSIELVVKNLQTDESRGLTSIEAERRLQQYGYNRLEGKEGINPFKLFLHQFFDLMIGLLVVAAMISAWIGEWNDTILIALIVIANAVIGFVQEWRAEKAVAALKAMTIPHARVWRDGNLEVVSVEMLVPPPPGRFSRCSRGRFRSCRHACDRSDRMRN